MTKKINKKDKGIFWVGALTGIVGGLTGNLWAGYFFELSNNPNWVNFFAVIIFTIILFGLLFYINNQIKKNK